MAPSTSPQSLLRLLFNPDPSRDAPSRALVPLRLAAGFGFVVSGAVKLLFENQGVERFAKLGFPAGVSGFVSIVEIACGLMLILGLFTRLAAAALTIDMAVAIVTTKLPIWLGQPPEPIAALPKLGFWAFAYQARLDVALLLISSGLVFAGAGAFSLDAIRARKAAAPHPLAAID